MVSPHSLVWFAEFTPKGIQDFHAGSSAAEVLKQAFRIDHVTLKEIQNHP